MPEWFLRGDRDRWVKAQVYDGNEYRVPADMTGLTVLDIGANIGTFSRLCAERGAKVVAYEPHPDNFAALVRNTKGLTVTPVEAAVGGHGRLYLGGGDPLGYSTCELRGESFAVKRATLDDALARCGAVDFFKLDAEGVEYELLEAHDLRGVKCLAVEFHDSYVRDARGRAEGCRRRLASLGFRELEWRDAYPDEGWYRVYRGERCTA